MTLVPGVIVRSLDADERHVYFAEGNAIRRVPLTGGAVEPVAEGQYAPRDVMVDGTHVYWANSLAPSISRVPKAGGAVEVFVAGSASSLVQNETTVFWWGSGGIMQRPKAGGTTTTTSLGGIQVRDLEVASDGFISSTSIKTTRSNFYRSAQRSCELCHAQLRAGAPTSRRTASTYTPSFETNPLRWLRCTR